MVMLPKLLQLDLATGKALADSSADELPEPAMGSIDEAMQKLQGAERARLFVRRGPVTGPIQGERAQSPRGSR